VKQSAVPDNSTNEEKNSPKYFSYLSRSPSPERESNSDLNHNAKFRQTILKFEFLSSQRTTKKQTPKPLDIYDGEHTPRRHQLRKHYGSKSLDEDYFVDQVAPMNVKFQETKKKFEILIQKNSHLPFSSSHDVNDDRERVLGKIKKNKSILRQLSSKKSSDFFSFDKFSGDDQNDNRANSEIACNFINIDEQIVSTPNNEDKQLKRFESKKSQYVSLTDLETSETNILNNESKTIISLDNASPKSTLNISYDKQDNNSNGINYKFNTGNSSSIKEKAKAALALKLLKMSHKLDEKGGDSNSFLQSDAYEKLVLSTNND
jgi:hypothetical protein